MRDTGSVFKLRNCQLEVYRSEARFRVLVAGRRFGKTHLALLELVRGALGKGKTAWYIAPSYRQAKRIAWRRLKALTKPFWKGKPCETELTIELQWGATIAVKGADKPDSLRGDGIDFAVLDEYALMKAACWREVIRPALGDRRGKALFMGTPMGCNHFYEIFEEAKTAPDWEAFHFTTQQGENVSDREMEDIARDLDARSYKQEIEAVFEGAGENLVYHAFKREEHIKPQVYDPKQPLVLTLDFNVEPMCALIAQKVGEETRVLNEITIEKNANTKQACERFAEATLDYRKYGLIKLDVYGDASGYQRRTSGLNATDWNIIDEYFKLWVGTYKVSIKAAHSNPGVRDRINCVNGRFSNAMGDKRLFIDPKCKELILDLEKVQWQLDGSGRALGDLDKRDGRRTHASDALGYYLAALYGGRGGQIGMKNDGRLILGELERR